MRTETIKVFSFDELKPDIQEKVIEEFRNNELFMDYPFMNEYMNEYLNELLKENKIKGKAELFYSLSYCQGDGCCFQGVFDWKQYEVGIQHRGNYYHSRSVEIIIKTRHGNEAKDEIYTQFRELFEKICDKIEKCGYSYIEAEQDSENIAETIRINEYEFLADGTMW